MTGMFRPHPNIMARVDITGNERLPILVIDNLVADPDDVVSQSLAAFKARTRTRSSFPGIVATAPEDFSLGILNFLLPTLQRVFGVSDSVQSGGCDFQLMTLGDEARSVPQRLPHFDVPDLSVLASVHYLCPPGFPGTAFYRHKSTGFEVISPGRAATYDAQLRLEVSQRPPADYINSDSDIFARIATYDAVYNRMIFFPAACLHSGLSPDQSGVPTSPESGRLTANMFLKFRR